MEEEENAELKEQILLKIEKYKSLKEIEHEAIETLGKYSNTELWNLIRQYENGSYEDIKKSEGDIELIDAISNREWLWKTKKEQEFLLFYLSLLRFRGKTKNTETVAQEDWSKNTSSISFYRSRKRKARLDNLELTQYQTENNINLEQGKESKCGSEEREREEQEAKTCAFTVQRKKTNESEVGKDAIKRETAFNSFILEYNREKRENGNSYRAVKNYLEIEAERSENLIPIYNYERDINRNKITVNKNQNNTFDYEVFTKEIDLVLDETVSKAVKIEILGSIEDRKYAYVIDKEKPFDIRKGYCKVATVESWRLKEHELPYGIVCVKEDGKLEIFDKGWVE